MRIIQISATFLLLVSSGTAQQPFTIPTTSVPRLVRINNTFHAADGQAPAPVESVTLSIYRDERGGSPLLQETQNVNLDSEGRYNVLMGSTLSEGLPVELFSSSEPRWLGVKFNRMGEVEQPRTRLASVPYALKASDAETLGGKPASAYLLAENPGAAAGSVATWGSAVPEAVSPRSISGSQGFFPYFTDVSNDLGNSVMQQASGSIGVGTVPGAAPAVSTPSLDLRTYPFSQIGMGQTTDYLTFFASDTYGPAIYWDPTKDLRFGKGGTGLYNAFGFTELMRIQSSTGNVGIGTLTPAAKLDVVGGLKLEGSGNGITFPDGTTQTTAGGGGGGGVTSLIAGTGLTASGTSGAVTVNVDTTKVPLLNASNTFTGALAAPNATIGNVSVTSTGITTAGVVHGGALASDTNIMLGGSIIYQQPYQNNTNTALGVNSFGGGDSSGTGNTASGYCAMNGNAGGCSSGGGSNNVPAGHPLPRAPRGKNGGSNPHPDASGGSTGSFNTAHGYLALTSIASGYYNTADGAFALSSNTTANGNTGIGSYALNATTTGVLNTAAGDYALGFNTTGFDNTATGAGAMEDNTTGYENAAIGNGALVSNTTGYNNTALGWGSLESNTTGTGNIAVGYQAGYFVTSGSSNIHIGNYGTAADSGVIRIGTAVGSSCLNFNFIGACPVQSSFFAAGIRGATTGSNNAVPVVIDSNGQLGTISSSRRFKDDIQDMAGASDGLMRLRPVTFRYKQPFEDGAKPLQYGLIAEEVAEVYPDLVARSADGQIETVKYQVLDPMLLNEVQKQREQLQNLEQQVKEQRQLNQSLVERLAKLEAALASTSPGSGSPAAR